MPFEPAPADVVAEREKKATAGSSVIAAVFLTILKLVVGLITGSLGILAEAAHSLLDLVAAAITYLAVRVSGKPADQDHPYGYGKVENFSAATSTRSFRSSRSTHWIAVSFTPSRRRSNARAARRGINPLRTSSR